MRKYFTLMGVFALIEISLALYLTFWRHDFWATIEARDGTQFIYQLIIFTITALALCFISAYATYLGRLSAIEWRKKLTTTIKEIKENKGIENFPQRVQEDTASYPDLFINICFGLFKAIIYLIVFSVTLILEFSYIYLILIVVYAIINTYVAKRIATPLIGLQYETQRVEATYRGNLSISNFDDCIRIMLGVAKRTKKLEYFQTFYGQIGVLIPICIVAPSYFTAVITFGSLMQAQSIMSTILENSSYGINSFAIINKFLSCRKRLKEINLI